MCTCRTWLMSAPILNYRDVSTSGIKPDKAETIHAILPWDQSSLVNTLTQKHGRSINQ